MLAVKKVIACNLLNGLIIDDIDEPKLIGFRGQVLARGKLTTSTIKPYRMSANGWIAGTITNACRADIHNGNVTITVIYYEHIEDYRGVEFTIPHEIIRENTIAYLKSNVQITCNNATGPPNVVVKHIRGHIPRPWITFSMRENPSCVVAWIALHTIKMPADVLRVIVDYLIL